MPKTQEPKRRLLTRRRFLQVLGAAGVAGIWGYWHAFHYSPYAPVVSRRRIAVKGLPSVFAGLNIVHLTDLHHSDIVPMAYLEDCIRRANALDPDVVFLTGDYITMDSQLGRPEIRRRFLEPLKKLFRNIRARIGVYAVLGNHDVAAAFHEIRDPIERAGIVLLQDNHVFLEREGRRLAVAGFRDFGTQIVDPQRTFGEIPPDEPALILMHNPDLFPDLDENRNGLIFAGHTHGGQVRIPYYGPVGDYIPSKYGNRYSEGIFHRGDLSMLVNRGLGMIRMPIRIHCRPEIAQVILEA